MMNFDATNQKISDRVNFFKLQLDWKHIFVQMKAWMKEDFWRRQT